MIIRSSAHLYVKIFLVTSLTYGLIAGMSASAMAGFWHGMQVGISRGLFFGFWMALFCGTIHELASRHMKADYTEKLFGVHQVQVLTVKQPFNETFETCLGTLNDMKRCRVLETNRDFGVIRARTGMSWKSFAEDIMITVSSEEPIGSKVIVSSRPSLKTTLVDYGKNVENVRSIVKLLSEKAELIDLPAASSADNSHSQKLNIEASKTKSPGIDKSMEEHTTDKIIVEETNKDPMRLEPPQAEI